MRILTVLTGLAVLSLSGCATIPMRIAPPNNAMITGIAAKCNTPQNCPHAFIRRFDGTNALALQRNSVPDDAAATQLAQVACPAGLHTVELTYRCGKSAGPEKAALYQVFLAEHDNAIVQWKTAKHQCYPVIKQADGQIAKPLIQYLAGKVN